jgi:hypothetical protein
VKACVGLVFLAIGLLRVSVHKEEIMPGGTDVSASIRAIAAHRPDIFGENIGEAEKQRP